jgi:hypothetical protein
VHEKKAKSNLSTHSCDKGDGDTGEAREYANSEALDCAKSFRLART